MKKTVIFGAGKIAEVVYHYMTTESPREVAGFTCDDEHIDAETATETVNILLKYRSDIEKAIKEFSTNGEEFAAAGG